MTAVAERELYWTALWGEPRSRQFYTCRSSRKIHPGNHIRLLSEFCQLAPYLIPKARKNLDYPTLRHPNLNLGNIILHPHSTQIAGIIDWQKASILPFFVQAGFPTLCNHDDTLPRRWAIPKAPDNFEQMSYADQVTVWREVRHQEAILFYTSATVLKCQLHMMALELPHLKTVRSLIRRVGLRWDGDLVLLQEGLLRIREIWNEIVPFKNHPCPYYLTAEEERAHRRDVIE